MPHFKINEESHLRIGRVYIQCYTNLELATQQLKEDVEFGHITQDQMDMFLQDIANSRLMSKVYASKVDTEVTVVFIFAHPQDTCDPPHRYMRKTVILLNNILQSILNAENLTLNNSWKKHWFIYAAERIFAKILGALLPEGYQWGFPSKMNVFRTFTVYQTVIRCIVSTNKHFVLGGMSKIYSPKLCDTISNFFTDKSTNHGIHIFETVYSDSILCIYVPDADTISKEVYVDIITTVYHELLHTMHSQLGKYEYIDGTELGWKDWCMVTVIPMVQILEEAANLFVGSVIEEPSSDVIEPPDAEPQT